MNLLVELDEMLGRLVTTRTRLQEGPNGEDNQNDLEQGAAGVILVRRLDIARNDSGTRDFVEVGLQDRVRPGEEGGEQLEALRGVAHRVRVVSRGQGSWSW